MIPNQSIDCIFITTKEAHSAIGTKVQQKTCITMPPSRLVVHRFLLFNSDMNNS